MQKITLPLVMIASLATLVSCGGSSQPVSHLSSPGTPAVTGVVVTTPSVSTGSATGGVIHPTTLTRTETVSYDSRTPEGMVQVEFSVTVADGTITAAAATPKTDKDTSKMIQTNFAKELSGSVVGKKAKDLHVDAIGGASLTTAAFETFVHSF